MTVLTRREVDHDVWVTLRFLSKVEFIPFFRSWLKRSKEGSSTHREHLKKLDLKLINKTFVFNRKGGGGLSIIQSDPRVRSLPSPCACSAALDFCWCMEEKSWGESKFLKRLPSFGARAHSHGELIISGGVGQGFKDSPQNQLSPLFLAREDEAWETSFCGCRWSAWKSLIYHIWLGEVGWNAVSCGKKSSRINPPWTRVRIIPRDFSISSHLAAPHFSLLFFLFKFSAQSVVSTVRREEKWSKETMRERVVGRKNFTLWLPDFLLKMFSVTGFGLGNEPDTKKTAQTSNFDACVWWWPGFQSRMIHSTHAMFSQVLSALWYPGTISGGRVMRWDVRIYDRALQNYKSTSLCDKYMYKHTMMYKF